MVQRDQGFLPRIHRLSLQASGGEEDEASAVTGVSGAIGVRSIEEREGYLGESRSNPGGFLLSET